MTVLILLNKLRASLQTELDNVFARLHRREVSERVVGASAFTQARAKLLPGAFTELLEVAVDHFYAHFPYRTVYGFRLLAFDGGTAQLPRTEAIGNHFGGMYIEKQDREVPMGRLMQLYDTENELCLALSLSPYECGEGDMALGMMQPLRGGDLVLADRGFSDGAFLAAVGARGADFCVRVTTIFAAVEAFADSRESDTTVDLDLRPKARKRLEALGVEPPHRLRVRLVKVPLPNGTTEILMTSLRDAQTYPPEIFADIYQRRWGVEEGYKHLKCRLEIDRFSGKTVHSVLQDVQAGALLAALNDIFCRDCADRVERERPADKHRCKPNRTNALGKLKHTIVLLFVRDNYPDLVRRTLDQIRRNIVPIRPDRTVPRSPVKRQPFAMAYKPFA